jgi:hypothetical protein
MDEQNTGTSSSDSQYERQHIASTASCELKYNTASLIVSSQITVSVKENNVKAVNKYVILHIYYIINT